uniref:Ig-like domain-containing protein n=1 Tax=Spermophilus dauricus TaxID=99837 RepID=A0A8C9PIA1_SPEDA
MTAKGPSGSDSWDSRGLAWLCGSCSRACGWGQENRSWGWNCLPSESRSCSLSSVLGLLSLIVQDSPPEPWACVFPELFLPPVLSAIPSPEPGEDNPLTLRCQTKPHPQKSTRQLFFSFHKNGHILQERSLHPELSIPEVKERDSGLYWCKVALEGHRVQKQSPPLEIKVQAPVSRPLLTLQPRAAGLAVGDVVELLCKAERGSPPILYSFYLNGEILGNYSALHGEAAPLGFLLKSEQDAGNYTCEAENFISRASSGPVKLSVNGTFCPQTRL